MQSFVFFSIIINLQFLILCLGDRHDGDAGAIQMEETIPLLISRATRSNASEQAGVRAKLPEKTREEMDRYINFKKHYFQN